MALSAKTGTADCSLGDVEMAVWLFWTQKIAGSFRAAQALIASCHSRREVVPSPTKEMATREPAWESGVGGRGSERGVADSFFASPMMEPTSRSDGLPESKRASRDSFFDSRLPTPDSLEDSRLPICDSHDIAKAIPSIVTAC